MKASNWLALLLVSWRVAEKWLPVSSLILIFERHWNCARMMHLTQAIDD